MTVKEWIAFVRMGTIAGPKVGPDRLTAWLAGGRSQSWLATLLGVSRPTVYRWCVGQTVPEPEHRRAIHDLTRGVVHFDDWYTDVQLVDAYRFSRSKGAHCARRVSE